MSEPFILTSTRIFTGKESETAPEAIVVQGKRIVFVGSKEEAHAQYGSSTPLHDYGDALIIPGFHDSHMHVFHSALYSSPLALSYRGESEADCVSALSDLAARRPAGSWLLTQGWREYRWRTPQLPSKHSLDAVYPHQPVAMYSGDAHTLWLNSCALEKLGLTPDSTPPLGGSYDKDEHGELTGIIRETAAMELMPHILDSFSDAELIEMYRSFLNSLSRMGITSLCDLALMPHPGLDFIRDDIYQRLATENKLPLRIHLFPPLGTDFSRFERLQSELTDDLVRVSGLKQFFDGVSSQHTAYLAEPYCNPKFPGDKGTLSLPFEEMRSLVCTASKKGIAVRLHTIGDEAIHLALDIFTEAFERYGALPHGHHCLEHNENLQAADIARFAQLGVIASVQPPHVTLDPGGPERDLGAQRIPYMWPFRTFLDSGVRLSFGTDSPVVPPNPFDVLYAAITRQDPVSHKPEGGWLPTEKITPAEALSAYTLGSAHAVGRAHELGTLEVGKLADIAVLNRDILHIDPECILETQVLASYVGGKLVFEG